MEKPLPLDSRDFLLEKAPATIYYIPNFISEEEEAQLLSNVYAAPKPKWQHLSNRRLQNWGGIVGKKRLAVDNNIPEWLTSLIDRICAVEGTFPQDKRPNHILINEYCPGQGIMPHTDGGAYYPLISTVSLGSHTMLDLYTQSGQPPIGSILVERRSLLLITDYAYTLLHGIKERTYDNFAGSKQAVAATEADNFPIIFNKSSLGSAEIKKAVEMEEELERETRVSLTIRNVPMVNSALMEALFKR